jgi:hypothetical protein
VLNFRYLFFLFFLLSFNSYSLLYCTHDDWYCVSTQDYMRQGEIFNFGFGESLEELNNSFNSVSDNFPNWETHYETGQAGDFSADYWSSYLTASAMTSQNAKKAKTASAQGRNDAQLRLQSSDIIEEYAAYALASAWAYSDHVLNAAGARAGALANANAAANSANAAANSANAAASSASAVQDDLDRVSEAQTQASTNINNQIQDIVDTIDEVQTTQALTDIEQYVQNVLNTPVNVVDHVPLMTAALGTGTGSLNALASNISNAGNSQDNTALVNSLNGLSSSVSNLGAVDNAGTLNAIGSLKGALGNNAGALGGLSDSMTDGDGNGEIGNRSAGLFNALKNSFIAPSFSSSGSNCPTWTFDDGALLVGGLVIDSHCEVIDMIRPSFELAMLSLFSVMGFRVVFSA